MEFPKELKYSKEHEWVGVEDGVATVGITDHAQDALGDIVYLELPNEGDEVKAGDTMGSVESVKAVSDIYSPVTGKVTSTHQELTDAPETVNSDPYGEGWMVKVTLADPSELDGLMDAAAYKKFALEESE